MRGSDKQVDLMILPEAFREYSERLGGGVQVARCQLAGLSPNAIFMASLQQLCSTAVLLTFKGYTISGDATKLCKQYDVSSLWLAYLPAWLPDPLSDPKRCTFRFSRATSTTTATKRTCLSRRSMPAMCAWCPGSGTSASPCGWSCWAVMTSRPDRGTSLQPPSSASPYCTGPVHREY